MEFTQLSFLFLWLPLTMAAYFSAKRIRTKNTILLCASLIFYAMGQPGYLVLLVGLSWLNFRLARKIRPDQRRSLIIPVSINIGMLVLLKYLDFFLGIREGGLLLTTARVLTNGLNMLGLSLREPTGALPMGVSFYTFSMVSYLVDVYRGKVKPARKFSNLLLYLTMFPKMLQGPIVRYADIAPQLRQRKSSPDAVFEGLQRFIFGLAKKVLLADYCGKVIADIADLGGSTCFVGAWLVGLMYFFRLYLDFSGYSDMAIGLGRIFGFTYCENFALPYTSTSVSEFWRRWHISLGSFFRDYVYIPMGGSRAGWKQQVINLLVVWALTGLWHGASWNYVIWGLYFFGVLVAEKHFAEQLERIPKAARRVVTLFLVFVGWVIFANEDLGQLGRTLAAMLGFYGFSSAGVGLKLVNSLPLIALCAAGCTSLPRWIMTYWYFICRMDKEDENTPTCWKYLYPASSFVVMVLLLWLCTVSLVGNTSAPSIYGGF